MILCLGGFVFVLRCLKRVFLVLRICMVDVGIMVSFFNLFVRFMSLVVSFVLMSVLRFGVILFMVVLR